MIDLYDVVGERVDPAPGESVDVILYGRLDPDVHTVLNDVTLGRTVVTCGTDTPVRVVSVEQNHPIREKMTAVPTLYREFERAPDHERTTTITFRRA